MKAGKDYYEAWILYWDHWRTTHLLFQESNLIRLGFWTDFSGNGGDLWIEIVVWVGVGGMDWLYDRWGAWTKFMAVNGEEWMDSRDIAVVKWQELARGWLWRWREEFAGPPKLCLSENFRGREITQVKVASWKSRWEDWREDGEQCCHWCLTPWTQEISSRTFCLQILFFRNRAPRTFCLTVHLTLRN